MSTLNDNKIKYNQKKCTLCKSKLNIAQYIIGNCKTCKNCYCQKHYLPECHKCIGQNIVAKKHFELNKKNLLNNKLKEIKIQPI